MSSSNGSFSTAFNAPAGGGSYILSVTGREPNGSVTPGLPARASFNVTAAPPQPAPDPDPPPPPSPPPSPLLPLPEPQDLSAAAVIVRVIDGDSVVARTAQGKVTVRLIGIDTPNITKPGTLVECGGREAAAAMRRFARVGERVTLTSDSTQATFNRSQSLLAYVTGDNGKLMQVEMLESGWARVYAFERRFKRYDRFMKAQRLATVRKRGVFRSCGGRLHAPPRSR